VPIAPIGGFQFERLGHQRYQGWDMVSFADEGVIGIRLTPLPLCQRGAGHISHDLQDLYQQPLLESVRSLPIVFLDRAPYGYCERRTKPYKDVISLASFRGPLLLLQYNRFDRPSIPAAVISGS
jgi:hypothetical protein